MLRICAGNGVAEHGPMSMTAITIPFKAAETALKGPSSSAG